MAMQIRWKTVLVLTICFHLPGRAVDNTSRSQLIEELMKGYDNRISPHFDPDVPTKVRVHVYVNSFDSIRESSMDYSMNFIITQKWTDPRLTYESRIVEHFLELDTKIMREVWVPDLYFANEKTASFHDVTVPNRMMHLYPNGTVEYRVRLTMTATCPMKLEKFPLDVQVCLIIIKSFVYTPENVVFKWDDGVPVTYYKDMQLSQFTLEKVVHDDCTSQYEEDDFTCVQAHFHLQRKYSYYLLHAFVPSTLIVVISWVSFWLPTDATAARIALCSMTVLTMITQRQSNTDSLPPVSYIKALDVWTVACLVFVFAAMLEYALVCFYSRQDCHTLTISLTGTKGSIFTTNGNFSTSPLGMDSDVITLDVTVPSPKAKWKAKQVDVFSRVLFPFCFAVFLVPYWIVYLR